MTRKITVIAGILAVILAVRFLLLPAWWHRWSEPRFVLKAASQDGGRKSPVLASGGADVGEAFAAITVTSSLAAMAFTHALTKTG